MSNKTVSLDLGSGGARRLAHIGVISSRDLIDYVASLVMG